MSSGTDIQSCGQISQRQQRLLMQCYCKTEYNTLFMKYYREDNELVCTRMDKHMFHINATDVCINFRRYRCPGVRVTSDAPRGVSTTKLLFVGVLLFSMAFA
ncbi:hypothetical protein GGF42_007736 [Coemansia sp. RSA 2424]|nr:hypothetical protein GGF42_007736 [Coemansia sp. RSA 2424]